MHCNSCGVEISRAAAQYYGGKCHRFCEVIEEGKKMATCKRCGKEDLIWKTSNRTGSFYLVESDGKTWHSKSCGVQKNPNVYRGACSNVPKADLTQCYWVLKGLYEQPWPATCHPELAERMAAALGVKLEEAKPEKSDRTEYDHRARTAEEDDSDPF